MMLKHMIGAAVLVAVGAAPAMAQGRVEVSGFASWVFADGAKSEGNVIAPDGNLYSKADPKDSASFGFSAAALINENAEAGFIYSMQPSTLVIGGTNDLEVGDLSVSTYHGYFGYTFGPTGARLRPYLLVGLGATQYGSVDAAVAGQVRSLPSKTLFSSTWGAGVKMFTGPRFGVRAGLRWTPGKVTADSAGWWCDPVYGCYVLGGYQYANQFELSGGVLVRF